MERHVRRHEILRAGFLDSDVVTLSICMDCWIALALNRPIVDVRLHLDDFGANPALRASWKNIAGGRLGNDAEASTRSAGTRPCVDHSLLTRK